MGATVIYYSAVLQLSSRTQPTLVFHDNFVGANTAGFLV